MSLSERVPPHRPPPSPKGLPPPGPKILILRVLAWYLRYRTVFRPDLCLVSAEMGPPAGRRADFSAYPAGNRSGSADTKPKLLKSEVLDLWVPSCVQVVVFPCCLFSFSHPGPRVRHGPLKGDILNVGFSATAAAPCNNRPHN